MKCVHQYLLVGVILMTGVGAQADFPVSDPAFDGNDYAVINQSQLKTVALYWAKELALSDVSISPEIIDLVNGFSQEANTAVVNLGQLKTVAQPFYDHLGAVAPDALPAGLPGSYPWSNPDSPPNDYAVANIGQVKHVFNFDLSNHGAGSATDTISGDITYGGGQTGNILVMASLEPYRWNRLFSTWLSGPGLYSIDVEGGRQYSLFAFMDVDGNGVGNGTEPWAVSTYNPSIDAGATMLTLALQDATGDQWLELNYFGDLAANINLTADEDGDTISNGDEYVNGTDWRNADSDGDGLNDNIDPNPRNGDSDNDGLGDGSDKALDDSLAANPFGKGVLVNIPDRGFYHAAETNLTLNYLGGQ